MTTEGRPCVAEAHDVALLDLDGVVYVGAEAVPHAAAALARARSAFGMRSVFVTNNAARPPATVAEHLVELGVPAQAADVVTSAQAGARMVADLVPPQAHVLAIGGPGVAEALRERDLIPVTSLDDTVAAVMQGFGPDVGWKQLAEGSLAIAAGLPWVATNTDSTIPTPRGRVLGNGSLVAALRHASGAQPLVAGKPEPPLMRESVQRAGAERPLVVGDRLDTDIEGAARSGIPSMLVLTGVTDWHEVLTAAPELRPDIIGRDLRDLLRPAPKVQSEMADGFVLSRCGGTLVRVPLIAGQPPVSGADGDAVDPGWWLPERWRNAGRRGAHLRDEDLDTVHALAHAAWMVIDSEARIGAPAEVRDTTQ